MDEEHKRHQEINRADMARQVLDNPVFKECLELVEKEIIEAWAQSNFRDNEGREKAWMMIVYGRKIRDILLSCIETGKMAQIQLEEKRRFRLFGG